MTVRCLNDFNALFEGKAILEAIVTYTKTGLPSTSKFDDSLFEWMMGDSTDIRWTGHQIEIATEDFEEIPEKQVKFTCRLNGEYFNEPLTASIVISRESIATGPAGAVPERQYQWYTRDDRPPVEPHPFSFMGLTFSYGGYLIGWNGLKYWSLNPEKAAWAPHKWERWTQDYGKTWSYLESPVQEENEPLARIVLSKPYYRQNERGYVDTPDTVTAEVEGVNADLERRSVTWVVTPEDRLMATGAEGLVGRRVTLQIPVGYGTLEGDTETIGLTCQIAGLGSLYTEIAPQRFGTAVPQKAGLILEPEAPWPSRLPNGSPLMEGDYILRYEYEIPSDPTSPKYPMPYRYTGEPDSPEDGIHQGWKRLEIESIPFDNSSSIMMDLLGEVLALGTTVPSYSSYWGFFQRLAAQEAFVQTLFSHRIRILNDGAKRGSISGGCYGVDDDGTIYPMDESGNRLPEGERIGGRKGFALTADGNFRADSVEISSARIEGELTSADEEGNIFFQTVKGKATRERWSSYEVKDGDTVLQSAMSIPRRWKLSDLIDTPAAAMGAEIVEQKDKSGGTDLTADELKKVDYVYKNAYLCSGKHLNQKGYDPFWYIRSRLSTKEGYAEYMKSHTEDEVYKAYRSIMERRAIAICEQDDRVQFADDGDRSNNWLCFYVGNLPRGSYSIVYYMKALEDINGGSGSYDYKYYDIRIDVGTGSSTGGMEGLSWSEKQTYTMECSYSYEETVVDKNSDGEVTGSHPEIRHEGFRNGIYTGLGWEGGHMRVCIRATQSRWTGNFWDWGDMYFVLSKVMVAVVPELWCYTVPKAFTEYGKSDTKYVKSEGSGPLQSYGHLYLRSMDSYKYTDRESSGSGKLQRDAVYPHYVKALADYPNNMGIEVIGNATEKSGLDKSLMELSQDTLSFTPYYSVTWALTSAEERYNAKSGGEPKLTRGTYAVDPTSYIEVEGIAGQVKVVAVSWADGQIAFSAADGTVYIVEVPKGSVYSEVAQKAEGSDGSYACRIRGGSICVSVGQSGVAVAGLKVVDGPLKGMATIGDEKQPFNRVIARGVSAETMSATTLVTCGSLFMTDDSGTIWKIVINSDGTLSTTKK